MTILTAVLLANADGRTAATLGAVRAVRPDRGWAAASFFGAFLLLAAISAAGASLASDMLGLGVLNLFAAMALGSAAAALMWTQRAPVNPDNLAAGPLPLLFVRLLLMQLGDRNQFLIFALGALSGAALWGVVGAMAGLAVATLPVLAFGHAVLAGNCGRFGRWTAAGLLILWAALYLRRAFGV